MDNMENQQELEEYRKLEERLRNRRIPSYSPDLASRLGKYKSSGLPKKWLYAASLLIVVSLVGYVYWQAPPGVLKKPDKEVKVSLDVLVEPFQKVIEVEETEDEVIYQGMTWVEETVVEKWDDATQEVHWDVWQTRDTEEETVEYVKENVYDAWQKFEFIVENYTSCRDDNGSQG